MNTLPHRAIKRKMADETFEPFEDHDYMERTFPDKGDWKHALEQRKYWAFIAKYEALEQKELDACLSISDDKMHCMISARPPSETQEWWFISYDERAMRSFVRKLKGIKPELEYKCYKLTPETGIPRVIEFIVNASE